MSDLDRIQRSFSRSFDTYDAEADTQARIAELLAQRLLNAGAPHQFARGFEIGCGTGLLSRALRATVEIAEFTLNDLCPEAGRTAERVGASFLPGDAQEIEWPEAPDLIASASTLQWMETPEALVARAADALATGGWLAFSSCGPQQFHELAELGSQAQAPGLRTAAILTAALTPEVEIIAADDDFFRMWFESPEAVLHHLRRTGVNGGACRPWTRAQLKTFCASYTARFGVNGRVPLTYHSVWLIVRKKD
jgi:malonyl-CoA O-methyltransferase